MVIIDKTYLKFDQIWLYLANKCQNINNSYAI
jgi:hypothetical protein